MAETKTDGKENGKSGLMGRALKISAAKKSGKGLLKHITEKNGAKEMSKVIVEKNGVFMIQTGIETSGIQQDPTLKALVEAVLK